MSEVRGGSSSQWAQAGGDGALALSVEAERRHCRCRGLECCGCTRGGAPQLLLQPRLDALSRGSGACSCEPKAELHSIPAAALCCETHSHVMAGCIVVAVCVAAPLPDAAVGNGLGVTAGGHAAQASSTVLTFQWSDGQVARSMSWKWVALCAES
jgi:hypothetical protein